MENRKHTEDSAVKKPNTGGQAPPSEKNTGGQAPSSEKNTGGQAPSSEKNTGGQAPSSEKNTGGTGSSSEKNTGGQAPSSEVVSLKFVWSGRKTKGPITIDVNRHETIIDGLNKSTYFTEKYKASQYLSIYARSLHAMINPSAPCGGLGDNEELELHQNNANVPETPAYRTGTGGLFIKVNKQGKTEGEAGRVILHHSENNRDGIPIAIFGYGEETIEDALHNDKRFLNINVRSLKGAKSKYESTVTLSQLPSTDTYTLIVSNDGKQPQEAGSIISTKPSCDPNAEIQSPPIESDANKEMAMSFVDEFNDYVKTKKNLKKAWSIIKKDFCNNLIHKRPVTARIIEILAQHHKNVAWILVRECGRVVSTGTFFLLTQSLGLTCYHVVKDVLKSPGYSIEISFHYTEMGAEPHYLRAEVETYSERYDYAFLRVLVHPYPGNPGGLLQYLALPPQDGAVAIIGHPQDKCKQVDFCSVINFSNRGNSVLEAVHSNPSFVHVLSMYNFLELLDPKVVTYKTCFYEGASGAPVFNERGELVAMHTGGYSVNASPTTESVIEYGRSTVEIIIMGAVEIEELRCKFLELVQRNEAIQSYMSSDSHDPKMLNVIASLKMLQMCQDGTQ